MDDKALIQALDVTLDRLTRQNADDAAIRQAMRELLKDWTPDDAVRQHRANQSRASRHRRYRRFLNFYGWLCRL
jgi:hypothetical protein